MQGQFEVNDGSKAATNQSGHSSSRLFEEYAQEVRPVRPPSPSVAAADGAHSGESSQRQGAFPTFMLGQEHILLNSLEVPSFKAPVPTYREVPPQISPANAESSEMKSKAEISAKIRENLDPCSVLFALDTAKALDENNLPEAQRLLNACGLDNPALLQDLKDVQDFALQIDYFDDKNQGLNLNLRWKLDAGDVYNLNRVEIGEANW